MISKALCVIQIFFTLHKKMHRKVLSFDGKKIAQGVIGMDKGDVNSWRNENPLLVSEKLKLEKSLKPVPC